MTCSGCFLGQALWTRTRRNEVSVCVCVCVRALVRAHVIESRRMQVYNKAGA